VRAISDGLSGAHVFAVTTGSGEYVLRVVPAGESERWARQLAIHKLAAEHAIAPRLELIDDGGQAVVSAKIGRTPFAAALEVSPRTVEHCRIAVGSQLEGIERAVGA
jgi:Ser/Thr protein kinase RdoA (MazF antagonist)